MLMTDNNYPNSYNNNDNWVWNERDSDWWYEDDVNFESDLMKIIDIYKDAGNGDDGICHLVIYLYNTCTSISSLSCVYAPFMVML